MKKYISGILLFAALLSFQSCEEEVDLVGEFEETAIVYGLLDQSDSVHMIKITRAFIGPGNSIEIAAIPDSNYFKSVDVTIKEYVNNVLQRTWVLDDTIVTNKDENGIFYAPEQKLYYFETSPSSPLLGNAEYRLHIDVNNGEFEVTAETELVTGMSCNASAQNFSFKFAEDAGEYRSTSIGVQTGNAYQVNATMTTRYTDIEGIAQTQKSFDWTIGEIETQPNSNISMNANGETFYKLMKASCLTGSAAVTQRRFRSFDIVITGGSEELYNYILVNKPSGSLAQSKPTFTNLSATNGHSVIGIFASRQTLRINKPFYVGSQNFIRSLDKKSTRELCQGSLVGPYLFCSDHPNDNILGSEELFSCP